MNISINLDLEQENALADLLNSYNNNREIPLSSEEYLQTVLIGVINDKVKSNFKETADTLVAAAKSVPYEQRLELIALVQSKLN